MKTFTIINGGPNRKQLITNAFSRKAGNRFVEFEILWRNEEINIGGTLKIKVEINEIARKSSSEKLFLKGYAIGTSVEGCYNPEEHVGYFNFEGIIRQFKV